MMDPDYDNVVSRIQSIYASSSLSEQKILKDILSELASTGYSYTYEQVYLADFKEVPVSIDQFISSSHYMGSVNRNGDAVYDFWKQVFRDVFNSGNQYNEIILSGATRVGKSSSMVVILCYMLYRLMLYRNPHEYFKKKEVSRFTIAFANLTKDLAFGVAYREYQDTLKEIERIKEIKLLSKKNEFCEASSLTMGSVYNPFFDFEGCGVELDYVSDQYYEECSEYAGRLFRTLDIHCDFKESDVEILENRECAVYFWSKYLIYDIFTKLGFRDTILQSLLRSDFSHINRLRRWQSILCHFY